MWTSGVSAAISFSAARKRGAGLRELATKALIRSAKLYLLGMLVINDATEWPSLRPLGVLQYFAVSYAVIGCLEALLPPSDAATALPSSLLGALRVDVWRYRTQWAAMLVLGFVYLSVQFLLPVPGCPTGYIGPGGLANSGLYPDCVAGAHKYVEVLLFGESHIYQSPTCSDVYECGSYDPEGVLGWISASWMAFLGLNVGRVLVTYRALGDDRGVAFVGRAVCARLAVAGLLLCTVAGALCGFSKEDGLIPVNKNLWSPSFVFLLAGWGALVLAGLFWAVDVRKWWGGAPFCYVGANSLGIYLVSEVCSNVFPLSFTFTAGGPASHAAALFSNCLCVLSLIALARYWHITKWSFNV